MRTLGLAETNGFVAIVERSSFAKPASHVGILRSPLSDTICRLEESSVSI